MLHLVGGAPERALGGEELAEARVLEAHCAETLACIVDCTVFGLRNDKRLTRTTAEILIATARDAALDLFPGSESVYNLVLAPRFTRLLEERFGPAEKGQPATVLSFQPRRQPAVPAPAIQIHAADEDHAAWWTQAEES